MKTDIDETLDWQGNEIRCEACCHLRLSQDGQCEPRRACVQDRYARRIDRFFARNPGLANGVLDRP
jgi:hypothetical protein